MTIDESEIRRLRDRMASAIRNGADIAAAIDTAIRTALAAEREQHARDVAEAWWEAAKIARQAEGTPDIPGHDLRWNRGWVAASRALAEMIEARAQALNDSPRAGAEPHNQPGAPDADAGRPNRRFDSADGGKPRGINQGSGAGERHCAWCGQDTSELPPVCAKGACENDATVLRDIGWASRVFFCDAHDPGTRTAVPPPSPASPTGETRDEVNTADPYGFAFKRARCGHVAYRNHDDLCIDANCPGAAYVVVVPEDAPASAPPEDKETR